MKTKPKVQDVKSIAGRGNVRDDGGRYEITVPRSKFGELLELRRPYVAAQQEWQAQVQAHTEFETVADANGGRRTIPSRCADQAGARGFHAVPHYGGARVMRMDDGLLWRQAGDDWEPTGRCSITRPFVPCQAPGCVWCSTICRLCGGEKARMDMYCLDCSARPR